MSLRPYQESAVTAALHALARSGSAVLQMPTGAGKTKAATEIIKRHGKTIWFVCHRQEIERQASRAFSAAGIDHGIVSPRGEAEYDKPVQIVSVSTLAKRMADLHAPALVIWDECHHVAAKSWAAIREALTDAKHVGLTATPERLDGKGLRDWFAELVVGPSVSQLIDDGYLSPFRYFAPSDPDLTAARLQAGDYKRDDISRIMSAPVLIGDAVSEYRSKADGKRALAFCASVEASLSLVERFNASGVPAQHVDGTTPSAIREQAIRSLESGSIKILSNVEVFTEGFDLPAIEAVILMRPTKSLALYLQMIGRALRMSAEKKGASVIDHAGLWLEHGWPARQFDWSLSGQAKLAGTSRPARAMRRCPVCKEVYSNRVPHCECGYAFPTGTDIGPYDGVLTEIKRLPGEGEVTREQFLQMLRKFCTEKSQTTTLQYSRKYGPFVNVREEMEHLRSKNYSFLPPIFSSRRKDYIEPGHRFETRFGISDELLEDLLGRPLRRHANGWPDIVSAERDVEIVRKKYMRLSELNSALGQWRTTRYRLTPQSPAIPVVNQELANGRFNSGAVWVDTIRALRWLQKHRPDVVIPPEVWPADNDNEAASKAA